jgi:hypothetical protein
MTRLGKLTAGSARSRAAAGPVNPFSISGRATAISVQVGTMKSVPMTVAASTVAKSFPPPRDSRIGTSQPTSAAATKSVGTATRPIAHAVRSHAPIRAAGASIARPSSTCSNAKTR